MSETNFDWDHLRLFLAVARGGGLASASEHTGKSAPTLGRRMVALERRLGADLFERSARGYTLTGEGQSLLEIALILEQGINPILRSAGEKFQPRVKISAGTWVSMFLSQHLEALRPDDSVIIQFIAAEHLLDIAHRETIIGIRNQRPSDISTAGRQIGQVKFAVYAVSPDVDTWAQVINSTPSARWVSENKGASPWVEVSNPRNALDLALAGSARIVLPTFIGSAQKPLQRVSDFIDELEHTQWLVTHHEERHLPKVRLVIDRLFNLLADKSQPL